MKHPLQKQFAIIMAGGRGERFWPVSRETTPKQLIQLLGDRSLLQETVHRILPVIPAENILVITNQSQLREVRRQLPNLPSSNLIAEPCGRDTCAAITLGAALVANRCPEGVMAVLPADHVISQPKGFQKVLRKSLQLASRKEVLVTIGIPPTGPSTAYGYIRLLRPKSSGGHPSVGSSWVHQVEQFVEKPPLAQARKFIKSGRYRWNAGMFIWSIASIRKALGEHQPEMALAMSRWCEAASSPSRLKKVLAREYPEITRISVDFALMEKAKNVMMAEGEFGWDDLGSWSALARHLKLDDHQNAIMGSCVQVDSRGNILFDARSPQRRAPVALVGVSQMIAVFTDDVCLIADQNKDQQIKELVQSLRQDQSLRHLL